MKLKALAKKLIKQFQKSASELEVDELREEIRELFYYRDVTDNLKPYQIARADKEKVVARINDMIELSNEILIKRVGKK